MGCACRSTRRPSAWLVSPFGAILVGPRRVRAPDWRSDETDMTPITPLELIGLPPLMALTSGRPDIVVGLLDGPVSLATPELACENICGLGISHQRIEVGGRACLHGTFVASILSARRGSLAPAICPSCTLLVRPIFTETMDESDQSPSATPEQLAAAIIECVAAGAQVLNLSIATARSSTRDERSIHDALDLAARHGVIVVAAAGNEGTLGSSAITRHPWVIPVVGYGIDGRPMTLSNLGSSVGKRGLGRTRRPCHQLRPGRRTAHSKWYKHRRSLCNRCDRAAIVRLSWGNRCRSQARCK